RLSTRRGVGGVRPLAILVIDLLSLRQDVGTRLQLLQVEPCGRKAFLKFALGHASLLNEGVHGGVVSARIDVGSRLGGGNAKLTVVDIALKSGLRGLQATGRVRLEGLTSAFVSGGTQLCLRSRPCLGRFGFLK